MIEALQNHVHLNTTEQKKQFEKEVGFIPGFPDLCLTLYHILSLISYSVLIPYIPLRYSETKSLYFSFSSLDKNS
jgi:hypothetical protein